MLYKNDYKKYYKKQCYKKITDPFYLTKIKMMTFHDVYEVCRLMTFVAFDVCCTRTFVGYDVCRI